MQRTRPLGLVVPQPWTGVTALKCSTCSTHPHRPWLLGTHLGLAVETGESESKVHGEAQSVSLPAAYVRFGLEKRINCEKTPF